MVEPTGQAQPDSVRKTRGLAVSGRGRAAYCRAAAVRPDTRNRSVHGDVQSVAQKHWLHNTSQRLVVDTAATSSLMAATYEVLESTEQVLVELGASLRNLVGADGYRALVRRAIYLASIEFPLLNGVWRVETSSEQQLGMTSLDLQAVDIRQIVEASSAILGHLLRLAEQFLGSEFVERLLAMRWPALARS